MEMKTYRDWNVDGCIGEGAFGRVYKISRQDFGHVYDAALKVIEVPQNQSEVDAVRNDGMSEQNVTQYFQSVVEDIVEEFALMSKLKGNSNIVSYEDHSVEKRRDGFGWNIYIRMELLTPLFSYIKQHKMTVRDVIQIGIDICQALEVCQKYNIIHRDIKPENIFVSDIGTYKLGDFGIARQLEKTSSGLSKKGTFTYMAPEVYKGLEYNSTVDIYSLGIVLYRFLNNNRSPFMPPASQPIRYSDKEKANIMRISGQRMPKPCNASGRLAEIVLKACAYNPSERYESAGIMRQALEEILYSDSERKLIYPAGDTLENKKADYILDETNRSTQKQVQETPEEPEDRTYYLFNGGTQGGVSQAGNVSAAGSVSKAKSMPAQETIAKAAAAAGMEEIKPNSHNIDISGNSLISNKENNSQVISGAAEKNDIPFSNTSSQEIQQNKAFKPALKFIIPGAVVIMAAAIIGIVALSGKEPSAKVPNLEGMSVEKAEETLNADGMVLKIVEEKYSDTADSGQIMSQSLKEGEETKQGTVIEVAVSKGREVIEKPEEEIQTILVPDFENLSQDEAEQRASEYKLLVNIKEEFSDIVKKGAVISQDVPNGTEAEMGSSIGLIVSKGQKPSVVPRTKGIKLEKAKKLLKSNKLKYKIEREYSKHFPLGTVIRQSITKGKKVERGTVVTITVSKGAKPVPTKAPQTSTYTSSSSQSGSSGSSGSSSYSSSSSSSGSGSSYKPPAATKKPAAPKPKPAPKPKKDDGATWSLIN